MTIDNQPNRAPLVSVCCLAYNHEAYLKECLDSILSQATNFSFEILVHDDASTDGTREIINSYIKKHPRIIKPIFQAQNQYSKGGLINPRFVFPKARGQYIALCEGDDYWVDNTKLQKQIDFLRDNPEYVITYTDCQPFDESGTLDIDFGGARRDLESIELQKATPIATLTVCFRNVLSEIPPDLLSARYGDLIIWSLLGEYGKGKYMGNISPSAYRVHAQGVHSKSSKKEIIDMGLITYSALYAYYSRISSKELSDYYLGKVFEYSIRNLGILRAIKVIVKRIYEKIGS